MYLQARGRSFSDQRCVCDDQARSRSEKQISSCDIGLDALPDNGQVDMHRVRETLGFAEAHFVYLASIAASGRLLVFDGGKLSSFNVRGTRLLLQPSFTPPSAKSLLKKLSSNPSQEVSREDESSKDQKVT